LLFAKQKDALRAEAQLKDALSLDPTFVPAAVDLPTFLEVSGGRLRAKRRCAPPCTTHLPTLHYFMRWAYSSKSSLSTMQVGDAQPSTHWSVP
jgi:hypothetical protein